MPPTEPIHFPPKRLPSPSLCTTSTRRRHLQQATTHLRRSPCYQAQAPTTFLSSFDSDKPTTFNLCTAAGLSPPCIAAAASSHLSARSHPPRTAFHGHKDLSLHRSALDLPPMPPSIACGHYHHQPPAHLQTTSSTHHHHPPPLILLVHALLPRSTVHGQAPSDARVVTSPVPHAILRTRPHLSLL